MTDYHLLLNGVKSSLFTEDSLRNLLSKGKIDINQMVSVNNGPWVRLYEAEAFKDLAPAPKVEEKKSVFVADNPNFGVKNFAFSLCQVLLFGLFMLLTINKFQPAYFGVWLELLFVAVYSLIFSEMIQNDIIKKQVVFFGYMFVVIMWGSVVVAYMR
jgi:hypothetical protein